MACYINKSQLEKVIDDSFCHFCHSRKNFDPLDCLECKIHSLSLLLEDLPSFNNFVPRDKANELVDYCAKCLKKDCPFPLGSCPDDDDWNCEDCWREILNKRFLI